MDKKPGICPISKKPYCRECEGVLYKCDPAKNTECDKRKCGGCRHTHNIKFAKNRKPVCPGSDEQWQRQCERDERITFYISLYSAVVGTVALIRAIICAMQKTGLL